MIIVLLLGPRNPSAQEVLSKQFDVCAILGNACQLERYTVGARLQNHKIHNGSNEEWAVN